MNDRIKIDITQNKINVDTNDKIIVVGHKTDLTNYYTIPEIDLKFLTKEEAQNTYATISSVDELSNIINSNRSIIDVIQNEINVMKESLVNVKSSADEAKNKAQEAYNLALEIDGSPRGVYASLSALQTAFPTGASGVYLTSDNGHWYFWNGTAWTDGGVYQSSEDINALKQEIKEFLIKEETKNLYDSSNVVSGILNLSTGLIESDDNTVTSDYIYIEQGQSSLFWSFKYNKLELSVVRVVFYDVNKNRIAGLTWRKSCTIPDGAFYVRFSTSISNNNNFVMLEYNLRTSSYEEYKKPYAIGHDTNHRELIDLISNFHNRTNLKYDIDFYVGMDRNGLFDPTVKSRIVSTKYYEFKDDTIIIIGKGMMCWIAYENGTNKQFTTTNAGKGYIVTAGSKVRLQFSVYPLDTSKVYTDPIDNELYKNVFIYSLKGYAYNVKQNNTNDTFVVSAHRGLSTLFPENTLTSIIQSKKLGLNCVEVDVKVTSDGQYVLGHNDIIYVNETTMKGNNSITSPTEEYPTALSISNNTYETISQYDIGSWKNAEYSSTRVPLLSDALKTAKKLNVDLILDSLETNQKALYTYNMVLKYGMIDHVRFSASTLTYTPLLSIKSLNEKVNLCAHATDTSGIDDIYNNLKTSTNDILISVPYQYINESIIEYAHSKSLKIGTYLVEDVNNALTYVNYGIDYMFTNTLFYIPFVMELDCN